MMVEFAHWSVIVDLNFDFREEQAKMDKKQH